MDKAIQRGTTYFGKEDEAAGKVGEIKSLNDDSEEQAVRLVHWRHLAPHVWLYNTTGLHGENPQDPINQLTHQI